MGPKEKLCDLLGWDWQQPHAQALCSEVGRHRASALWGNAFTAQLG